MVLLGSLMVGSSSITYSGNIGSTKGVLGTKIVADKLVPALIFLKFL